MLQSLQQQFVFFLAGGRHNCVGNAAFSHNRRLLRPLSVSYRIPWSLAIRHAAFSHHLKTPQTPWQQEPDNTARTEDNYDMMTCTHQIQQSDLKRKRATTSSLQFAQSTPDLDTAMVMIKTCPPSSNLSHPSPLVCFFLPLVSTCAPTSLPPIWSASIAGQNTLLRKLALMLHSH